MQQNLYLLPALFGEEQERLDIWHGSSDAEKIYIQYAPPDVFTFWDEAALQWAKQTYGSLRFRDCLLYTSDAADERSSVDLGGRRIIKKKKSLGIMNRRTSYNSPTIY